MTTAKLLSSEQIRREISAVDPDLRISRSRAIAVRLLACKKLDQLRGALLCSRGGEDLDSIENNKNVVALAGPLLTDAQSLEFLAQALETAPITEQAREILDPLFLQLAEAEAREAKERDDEHARQAAIEAERRRMIDDVLQQITEKFGPSPTEAGTVPPAEE